MEPQKVCVNPNRCNAFPPSPKTTAGAFARHQPVPTKESRSTQGGDGGCGFKNDKRPLALPLNIQKHALAALGNERQWRSPEMHPAAIVHWLVLGLQVMISIRRQLPRRCAAGLSGATLTTWAPPVLTSRSLRPSISAFGAGVSLEGTTFATLVTSLGSSPVEHRLICRVLPARQTVSCTDCPDPHFEMIVRWRSRAEFTFRPIDLHVMTSAGRKSLLYAGASASTVSTTTPWSIPPRWLRKAVFSASVSIRIPNHARCTLPAGDQLLPHVLQHARRNRKGQPPADAIDQRIHAPTIRPSTSKSGPPLLPGLMNASVWM